MTIMDLYGGDWPLDDIRGAFSSVLVLTQVEYQISANDRFLSKMTFFFYFDDDDSGDDDDDSDDDICRQDC